MHTLSDVACTVLLCLVGLLVLYVAFVFILIAAGAAL